MKMAADVATNRNKKKNLYELSLTVALPIWWLVFVLHSRFGHGDARRDLLAADDDGSSNFCKRTRFVSFYPSILNNTYCRCGLEDAENPTMDLGAFGVTAHLGSRSWGNIHVWGCFYRKKAATASRSRVPSCSSLHSTAICSIRRSSSTPWRPAPPPPACSRAPPRDGGRLPPPPPSRAAPPLAPSPAPCSWTRPCAAAAAPSPACSAASWRERGRGGAPTTPCHRPLFRSESSFIFINIVNKLLY